MARSQFDFDRSDPQKSRVLIIVEQRADGTSTSHRANPMVPDWTACGRKDLGVGRMSYAAPLCPKCQELDEEIWSRRYP
jgi:hypothetical protein